MSNPTNRRILQDLKKISIEAALLGKKIIIIDRDICKDKPVEYERMGRSDIWAR